MQCMLINMYANEGVNMLSKHKPNQILFLLFAIQNIYMHKHKYYSSLSKENKYFSPLSKENMHISQILLPIFVNHQQKG